MSVSPYTLVVLTEDRRVDLIQMILGSPEEAEDRLQAYEEVIHPDERHNSGIYQLELVAIIEGYIHPVEPEDDSD